MIPQISRPIYEINSSFYCTEMVSIITEIRQLCYTPEF